jgi:hypothetical protein
MGIFIGSGLAFLVGGPVVDLVTHRHALTLPILGTIAAWRLTFLFVGLPGFLFALLTLTIREPQRRNLLTTRNGRTDLSLHEILRELRIRAKSLAGISTVLIFCNAAFFAFTAWTPAFFARVHGWSAGQTGRTIGPLVMIFGCAGMFCGGSLCNRWLRSGMEVAPLRVAVWGGVGLAITMPLFFWVRDAAWSVALCGPAIFFSAFPVGTLFGSAQMLFPNQVRGVVGALILFILNLGGQTLGPLLPGILTDYLFRNEGMIGGALAITTAVCSVAVAIVARLTFAAFKRHYRLTYSLFGSGYL